MALIFNMHEAKTKLSKLVEMVEAGQEVSIARNGVPVVTLNKAVRITRPLFGEFVPIKPEIPEGFDPQAPLAEWQDAFDEKDKFLKSRQVRQQR